ncbi:MAG TPA: aminotransferase class V-fold PLP-dependent enzyme [Candidatus Angelobacter sp.]|nr:aminotransferase class V-fold PLP-dependent enzyme [Candidatus Angelobacter sp.]
MNRREFVSGMAALGSATVLDGVSGAQTANPPQSTQNRGALGAPAPASSAELSLPRKADFAIPEGETYINSAYVHPMPIAGREALRRYAESRSGPVLDTHYDREHVKAEFASLINAKPSEISYVQSTSTGENLVVNGLGIVGTDSNVVTDALHFDGALLHLGELKRRSGLDVRIVMPRDWRIDLKDLERVIDRKTKLVEISLVAMANGFQHDLKAVCDLAHAHGAYVYADIVQAAGNTPIDVRASGLDFAAGSTFKWLMGDFGLGFLYVKEELLDRVLGQTQFGYYQAEAMQAHFLPGDDPASTPYSWKLYNDATGHFEVGTSGSGAQHILAATLPYIRKIGVEKIQAYRQPFLKKLREEMPRLGFASITPPESTSAITSFAMKDRAHVLQRLQKANVNVRVAEDFLRVSPSVFNDMGDIERLLAALS